MYPLRFVSVDSVCNYQHKHSWYLFSASMAVFDAKNEAFGCHTAFSIPSSCDQTAFSGPRMRIDPLNRYHSCYVIVETCYLISRNSSPNELIGLPCKKLILVIP